MILAGKIEEKNYHAVEKILPPAKPLATETKSMWSCTFPGKSDYFYYTFNLSDFYKVIFFFFTFNVCGCFSTESFYDYIR